MKALMFNIGEINESEWLMLCSSFTLMSLKLLNILTFQSVLTIWMILLMNR